MNNHVPWMDNPAPHSHHSTVRESGACSECRAWNIGVVKDGSHAFLLTFPPNDGNPPALSLVRSWSPDISAVDTAWATGCNLPRGALIEEIPVGLATESGVEMFRLHEGAEAADALRVIRGLRETRG